MTFPDCSKSRWGSTPSAARCACAAAWMRALFALAAALLSLWWFDRIL
jgi:hypothetical protein